MEVRWGLLADFFRVLGPPLRPNVTNLTRQKSLFADGLWRRRSGYAQLLVQGDPKKTGPVYLE